MNDHLSLSYILGLCSPTVGALEREASVLRSIHNFGESKSPLRGQTKCSDPMVFMDWGGVLFMSLMIWHLWGSPIFISKR